MQSDAAIRAILARRVDEQRRSPGVAVGLLTAASRRVFVHGRATADRPVAADTIFEIGSITKPFTALLLCDAARRGELALDDRLARWLPAGAKPPKGGEAITLIDLATHHSGMPTFLPGMPEFGTPPWATYSTANLLEHVAAFELPRAPGAQWEYCNTGYGLLGLVLGAATGRTYAELLQARVLDVLGMADTHLHVPPAKAARVAAPHSIDGSPAPPIAIGALAPAGALKSTADDLMTFLAAAIGLTDTPLADAFADMLSVRRSMSQAGAEQAIGWIVMGSGVGHNGGTSGMASTAFFDATARDGVVAFGNSTAITQDFALNLVRPELPGDDGPAFEAKTAIELSADVLERCVGRYALGEMGVAEVTREGDHIVFKAPTSPHLPMQAASPSSFFSPSVPLTLDFELPGEGPATSLMIHFSGQDIPAPRAET